MLSLHSYQKCKQIYSQSGVVHSIQCALGYPDTRHDVPNHPGNLDSPYATIILFTKWISISAQRINFGNSYCNAIYILNILRFNQKLYIKTLSPTVGW